jgi:uncharacterized membrane-anchored protein
MTEFLSTIQNVNWTMVFDIALQVCGLFSLLAAVTPNTSDNAAADFLLRSVNALGANFNRARNTEP